MEDPSDGAVVRQVIPPLPCLFGVCVELDLLHGFAFAVSTLFGLIAHFLE